METKFDKTWENAISSIVRLETLPIYEIPAEMARFEKFKKGIHYLDEELVAWKEKLKTTAEKKVSIIRYRVVDTPISDYIKFEFDFWKKTIDSQHVFTIERNDYLNIVKNADVHSTDFWMFDKKTVYCMNYSPKGNFIDGIFKTDKKTVQQYKKIIEALASKAASLRV